MGGAAEKTGNTPEPDGKNKDWGYTYSLAVCENCDWRYLLPETALPQTCPYCFERPLTPLGKEDSMDESASLQALTPELLVQFALSPAEISRQVEQFTRGIRFAPWDLTMDNLAQRMKRVYLPMWLVDASAQGTWQTEAGFNYQVVSHQEQYDQNRGGWRTKEVQESRIRWEARVGRLTRSYENVAVPALEDHRTLTRKVGGYALSGMGAYETSRVQAGFVRLPDRNPEAAWHEALPALKRAAAEECRLASGADHLRNFDWRPAFQDQHWTLLLLPLYSTYYLDGDGHARPVYLNGQSGQLSGERRASQKRAQRAAVLILGVAGLILLLSLGLGLVGLFAAPALIAGGIGLVAALLIACAALVPSGIVWQFNRAEAQRELFRGKA